MVEKIFIVPMLYILLIVMGLIMMPYCLWCAWEHIIPLKSKIKGLELALRRPE